MSSSNGAVRTRPEDDEVDKWWPEKPLDHSIVAKTRVTSFSHTWKISELAKSLQGSSPLYGGTVSNPELCSYELKLVHRCHRRNFDLEAFHLELRVTPNVPEDTETEDMWIGTRGNHQLFALFKACVIRADGVKTCIAEDHKEFRAIETSGNYTFINFVRRDDVFSEECGLLNNGEFTVMCSVTLTESRRAPYEFSKYPADQEIDTRPIPVNQFSDVLAVAFKRKLYTDVALVAGGKEFPAHRAVLAAISLAFRAKIENPDNTQAVSSIAIEDFTAQTIDDMLVFIYEGWTPTIRSNASTLLAVAHQYDISSLKSACEEELALRITSKNAADMLLLADRHHAHQLQRWAAHWTVRHPCEVAATERWNDVLQNKSLLEELIEAHARLLQSMTTDPSLPLSTKPTGMPDKNSVKVSDHWWPTSNVTYWIPFKMKANTFTCRWQIENFRECLRQNSLITSDQFDENGCSVCLKLTHRDEHGAELQFFQFDVELSSTPSCTPHPLYLFRACVVRADGIKANVVAFKDTFHDLYVNSKFCTLGPFLRRRDVFSEERPLLNNDKLTILCSVTIASNGIRTPDPVNRPLPVVPFRRSSDLLVATYKEKKFTDITLVVGDQQFPVHRAFLASASSVFRRMFETETEAKTITIEDFEPEVVDDMLHFIYTDRAPNIRQNARGLLAAADKYGIETLKPHCELEMALGLTVENAADTLMSARRHSAPQLKQSALHLISRHLCDVMGTEGWKAVLEDTGAMAVIVGAIQDYLRSLTTWTE